MVGLISTLNQRFEYIKIEYSHTSLLKEIFYESDEKRNIKYSQSISSIRKNLLLSLFILI